MKILVTGGRSPYTLELIRLLGKSGHEVISVECLPIYLSQFSKYLSKKFQIGSPVYSFSRFQAELLKIVDQEKIDLIIPTCEEIFYISKLKNIIPEKTRLFCEDFALLSLLHSKWDFIQLLKKNQFCIPRTFQLNNYSHELLGQKVVLKKKFSRFASNVYIINEAEIESLNLQKNEWVVQEFIPGLEGSIYALFNNGDICAYSCYLKEYSISGGATIIFKHYNGTEILNWLKKFSSSIPQKITGQFSFDFILNEKNELYPIECNPRPTSGIHLFCNQPDLVKGFFEPIDTLQPDSNLQIMLGLAMITFGFSLKKFPTWLREFTKSQDAIFSTNDPLPFLTQFFSFAYFILIAIKKRIKVIEATTLDIEFNGDEF